MATILPPSPSASLAPSGTLTPSSTTYYVDAPTGTIGGTLVVGGGGIVKVGGSSVNQQPQRRQPRVYPQQAPPRLIHIEYRMSHDAPTGRITLAGSIGEAFTPGAARLSPVDVLELKRRFRLVYQQPDAEQTEQPIELSRDLLAPFIGVNP